MDTTLHTHIIKDRIENHLTLQALADKYGFRWQTIKKILVDSENYTDARHPQKVNYWNQEFFNEMNPITAYWAGFGFADGCVSRQTYGTKFHIILQYTDLHHLEKFSDAIQFHPNKIIKTPQRNSATIQIYSHGFSLIESLKKWGIVERKTYNFVEPKIPKKLISHFLRGWIDGDGYIGIKRYNQRLDITGHLDALDWGIQQFRNLGYQGHVNIIEKPNKHWGHLLITGINQIRFIGNSLHAFDHTLPKLNRKWDKLHSSL